MNAEPDNTKNDPVSLRHDVVTILMDCHRDRRTGSIFRNDVSIEEIAAMGEFMSRRLGLTLGGHYVPKRDARAARDSAVWRAFNGSNQKDVIRDFKISKRLLYNILARKRRAP